MSQNTFKTIIYGVLLLSACGCLGVVVLVGGVAAYSFFHTDLGIPETDIGVDLGEVPDVPLWDQWLKPSTGPGAEASGEAVQEENPLEGQANQPQPIGSPESAYSEEAKRECAEFGDVFPQLELNMAWKSADELTCGFGQKGSQKFVALIGITEYATESEAAQNWAGDWGTESQYAAAVGKYAQQAPDVYTYSHEGSRFFLAAQVSNEGQPTYYAVGAGRLYGNAVVEFRDEQASSNATAEWEMVEGLAMELVDKHNTQ